VGLCRMETSLCVFIFAGVFLLSLRQNCSPSVATLLTLLAALLGTVSFGPRTLLFGWLCLVMQLLLIEWSERSPIALLGLAPLFALWINLHGSWLIGFVLLLATLAFESLHVHIGSLPGGSWSRQRLRYGWLGLALSASGLFLNPYGWRLMAYPFDLAFRQHLNLLNVEEWQPLNPHSFRGILFFSLLAALFLLQLLRKPSWTPVEIGKLLLGAASAVLHTRFTFLAGILVLPTLSGKVLLRDASLTSTKHPTLNALLFTLLAGSCVVVAKHKESELLHHPQEHYPYGASRYIQDHPLHGNLFNECLWGGFMSFRDPRLSVFIDSRMDIFERSGVLADYLDVIHIHHSASLLAKYNIQYVLYEPGTPLVDFLEATKEWKPIYKDSVAVLLQHNSSAQVDMSSSSEQVSDLVAPGLNVR